MCLYPHDGDIGTYSAYSGAKLPLFVAVIRIIFTRLKTLVDFFASWANREFLRITSGSPHLTAQRANGFTGKGGFHDFFLTHVVREAFMVARLRKLGFFPLK